MRGFQALRALCGDGGEGCWRGPDPRPLFSAYFPLESLCGASIPSEALRGNGGWGVPPGSGPQTQILSLFSLGIPVWGFQTLKVSLWGRGVGSAAGVWTPDEPISHWNPFVGLPNLERLSVGTGGCRRGPDPTPILEPIFPWNPCAGLPSLKGPSVGMGGGRRGPDPRPNFELIFFGIPVRGFHA